MCSLCSVDYTYGSPFALSPATGSPYQVWNRSMASMNRRIPQLISSLIAYILFKRSRQSFRGATKTQAARDQAESDARWSCRRGSQCAPPTQGAWVVSGNVFREIRFALDLHQRDRARKTQCGREERLHSCVSARKASARPICRSRGTPSRCLSRKAQRKRETWQRSEFETRKPFQAVASDPCQTGLTTTGGADEAPVAEPLPALAVDRREAYGSRHQRKGGE